MKIKLEKIISKKLELKEKIKNKYNFYKKKNQEQKLKIKRIRNKIEIPKTNGVKL
jgi:hypothetical protein